MSINKRLLEVIKHIYNGNKRAFASAVGVSPTVIENVVGSRQGKPSFDLMAKICANANISAEWLLSGDGEMSKTTIEERIHTIHDPSSRRYESQSIPLYRMQASASIFATLQDANITPEAYINIPNITKIDGAIYVSGDSMYPHLKSGDIAIFQNIQNPECIVYGNTYLISFCIDGDEYIVLKYIHRSNVAENIRLVSHNELYDDFDIPRISVRSLALVKASIRYSAL